MFIVTFYYWCPIVRLQMVYKLCLQIERRI